MTINRHLVTVSGLVLLSCVSARAESTGGSINLRQDGAQNTATIEQTGATGAVAGGANTGFAQIGTGNALTVNQTGAGNQLSTAKAGLQNGVGNTARTDQSGQNNRVELQQIGTANGVAPATGAPSPASLYYDFTSGAYVSDTSRANRIDQTGSGSVVDLRQDGRTNTFDITQSGTGVRATVRQIDSNNRVFTLQGPQTSGSTISVLQKGATGTQTGNYAAVAQNETSTNDSADITQDGTGNRFIAVQLAGSGNRLTGTQIGSANRVETRQANGSGNGIDLLQNGSGNNVIVHGQSDAGSTISSTQIGQDKSITIFQFGGNNRITNRQTGGGYSFVQSWQFGEFGVSDQGRHVAETIQVGANNSATSTQNKARNTWISEQTNTGNGRNVAFNSQDGRGNTARNTQTGTDLEFSNSQSGDNGSATNIQVGTKLYAAIYQANSGNVFTSTQTGSGHRVLGLETSYDAPLSQTGVGNWVTSDQSGLNNLLRASQTVGGNILVNMQGGSGNELRAKQTGTTLGGNAIINQQYGIGGLLVVTQTGNANYAESLQSGGVQTATIDQSGMGNQVYGLQSGSGLNTTTVDQLGSANVARYAQIGSGNVATLRQR